MSAIILLICASLFVALGFLGFFLWAVKSGQFKDKYTPSVRMLFDDPKVTATNNHENKDT